MGYKKILLPLDGSKLAEQAIKHVITVAEPGAYIGVLSIMAEDRFAEIAALATSTANLAPVTGTESWPPIESIRDPRAIRAREDYLMQITEWLEPMGYTVRVEARPGEVVNSIIETARDNFDVIVMATHGRTGMAKVVLGSVAEAVLHKAPCPVLIVPVRHEVDDTHA